MATPGPSPARPAAIHWRPAQKGRYDPGREAQRQEEEEGQEAGHPARGKRKRNAPRIAEMAPEAPTRDCREWALAPA